MLFRSSVLSTVSGFQLASHNSIPIIPLQVTGSPFPPLRLRDRLKTLRAQASQINFHAEAEMELDVSVYAGGGPAYAALFTEHESAEDEEMETRRMWDLIETVDSSLAAARKSLRWIKEQERARKERRESGGEKDSKESTNKDDKDKKDQEYKDSITVKQPESKGGDSKSGDSKGGDSKAGDKESPSKTDAATKTKIKEGQRELDRLLWKLEVDVENVEDILSRYVDNQKETSTVLEVKWQETQDQVRKRVSEGLELAGDLWSEGMKWLNKEADNLRKP